MGPTIRSSATAQLNCNIARWRARLTMMAFLHGKRMPGWLSPSVKAPQCSAKMTLTTRVGPIQVRLCARMYAVEIKTVHHGDAW